MKTFFSIAGIFTFVISASSLAAVPGAPVPSGVTGYGVPASGGISGTSITGAGVNTGSVNANNTAGVTANGPAGVTTNGSISNGAASIGNGIGNTVMSPPATGTGVATDSNGRLYDPNVTAHPVNTGVNSIGNSATAPTSQSGGM